MADALTIDVSSLLKGVEKLKTIPALLVQKLDDVLTANVTDIQTEAKSRANVGVTGGLQNEIFVKHESPLIKHITVNAFYAPFVEFGTGKYVKLPPDASWQTFAAQYKGKKGSENVNDMFANMVQWVQKKGLHGVTASGRSKRGKKATDDIYRIAAAITIHILRHGSKPHPFLYPA
jgi:hypothetical protein